MGSGRHDRASEVDVDASRAAVQRWVDAGYTLRAIARAAGLAHTSVNRALRCDKRVHVSTERALLAVTERMLRRDSDLTPASPVRDHVAGLLASSGGTVKAVQRASGVDDGAVADLLNGVSAKLTRGNAERLLALREDDVAQGMRRRPAKVAALRCRQLQARGWPLGELARRLGQAGKVPTPLRPDNAGFVSPEVDDAIRGLWLELRYQRGPSGRAERDARRAGYYPAEAYDARGRLCRPWLPLVAEDPAGYPPAAYDDDGTVHVDWLRTDEGEALAAVREHKEQVVERRREVLRLTELGWSAARIAEHLGCSRDTVHADRKRVPGREETAA